MTEPQLIEHARRAARETALRLVLPDPTPAQIETARMYLGAEPTRERTAA